MDFFLGVQLHFTIDLLEKLLDGLIIREKNKKHYSDVVLMRISVFARKI